MHIEQCLQVFVAAYEFNHFIKDNLGLVCFGGCAVDLCIFVFGEVAVEGGQDPIEYAFALLPGQLDI